jgi:hypothetical protein
MEQAVLWDKTQFPSEDVIFSHIGSAKVLWVLLFEYIHKEHADFSEEWRYYNDGKSWLLKVTKKKKTIFWLSLVRGSFRTTFYFNDKAEKAILESEISDSLKELYKNGKKKSATRGLTIYYTGNNDIENAKTLIEIKSSMK